MAGVGLGLGGGGAADAPCFLGDGVSPPVLFSKGRASDNESLGVDPPEESHEENRQRFQDECERLAPSTAQQSLGIEDALVPLHSLAANWTKYINK